MEIRFKGLDSGAVGRLQAGGLDANGQIPERHISTGGGTPCRHCLRQIAEGAQYLILSFRPFPAAQPYAEQGPIFLHAEACPAHPPGNQTPAMLTSPRYLLHGYDARDRIVYGSGQIIDTGEIPHAAAAMLVDDRLAYVHIRSASNNCYQCRVDRA